MESNARSSRCQSTESGIRWTAVCSLLAVVSLRLVVSRCSATNPADVQPIAIANGSEQQPVIIRGDKPIYIVGNQALQLSSRADLDAALQLARSVNPRASNQSQAMRNLLRRSIDYSQEEMDQLLDKIEDGKVTLNGPECIPQVSDNFRYNPYHRKLLSRAGAEVRHILGEPTQFDGVLPLDCTSKTTACTMEVERGTTYSLTRSISITGTNSDTVSRSNGRTTSTGTSDSATDSITRGSEKALNIVDTATSDEGYSESVNTALGKTQQQSTSKTGLNSNTKESSKTHGLSHNHEATISAEATVGAFGTEVKASGSTTHGLNVNDQNTDGSSSTNSESSEKGTNDGVSISMEAARGKTRNNGRSSSRGVTNTQSRSDTNSRTRSYETNEAQTSNNERATSKSSAKEEGRTSQATNTLNSKITFQVEAGTCRRPVCRPAVRSKVVPYKCVNNRGDELKDVNAELSVPDMRTNPCTFALVPCDLKTFSKLTDDEYNMAARRNSIESGDALHKDESLISRDEKYKLKQLATGELQLKKFGEVIWSNGIKLFDGFKVRTRISDLGHLVTEISTRTGSNSSDEYPFDATKCKSSSIFSKADRSYKCGADDWLVVWSSAPVRHTGVQIGIPRRQGRQVAYKLIVSDSGSLSLFDAFGVNIWCSHEECQHYKGYKYPRNYQLPTDVVTEEVPGDPHNSQPEGLKLYGHMTSMETASDCDSQWLGSSRGLASPKGRFKLLISEKGSVIVKDGPRTMWDSMSSNVRGSKPPYRLTLTKFGRLLVRDSQLNLVWASRSVESGDKIGPFKLLIADDGQAQVRNKDGHMVWSAWPTSNLSGMATLRRSQPFCMEECQECKKISHEPTAYDFLRIKNQSTNKCMALSEENKIVLDSCDGSSQSIRWTFDGRSGRIHNSKQMGQCLRYGRGEKGRGDLSYGPCDDENSPWIYFAGTIRAKRHTETCIDNSDSRNQIGNKLVGYECWPEKDVNLAAAQKWEVIIHRPVMKDTGHKVIKLQDGGKCLQVSDSTGKSELRTCNGGDSQLWSYDSTNKLLRSKRDPNKCLTRPTTHSQPSYLELGACDDQAKWDYDGHNLLHLSADLQCIDNEQFKQDEGNHIGYADCQSNAAQSWLLDEYVVVTEAPPPPPTEAPRTEAPKPTEAPRLVELRSDGFNRLAENTKLYSRDGSKWVQLTDSGRLELSDGSYADSANSDNHGQRPRQLVLNKDGVLSIICATGCKTWSTPWMGRPAPFKLTVNEDGGLELRDSDNSLYWRLTPNRSRFSVPNGLFSKHFSNLANGHFSTHISNTGDGFSSSSHSSTHYSNSGFPKVTVRHHSWST